MKFGTSAILFLFCPMLVKGTWPFGKQLRNGNTEYHDPQSRELSYCVPDEDACLGRIYPGDNPVAPEECCNDDYECTVDKESGMYYGLVAKCLHKDTYEDFLADRKTDKDIKKRACEDAEECLDSTYDNIKDILKDKLTKDTTGSTGLDLQLEFLCDFDNPGLWELSEFQRQDYVNLCTLADQAECEVELAEATKNGDVLWRKLIQEEDGTVYKIDYKKEGLDKKIELEDDGYVAEQDCGPIMKIVDGVSRSPFAEKPLPFECLDLKTVCDPYRTAQSPMQPLITCEI